jgi:hypothetical protein
VKVAYFAVVGAAAALLTAGAISLPGPANADDGCYMPNCYAANAFSPSARQGHSTADASSQASADSMAVAGCNKHNHVSDCHVVARISGTGCTAVTDTGSGGTGSDQSTANVAALRGGGKLLDPPGSCN